ncbi:VPLPA-CTERM sorting domain-containing protein [Celeribacter arenosi]|uniref:VPLPA-CTERM protein sorting domain-containing protein n=1 Tax=Celeribacter arenosi TaxID=792649 RepID=A0ABP7KDV1_9RHOB
MSGRSKSILAAALIAAAPLIASSASAATITGFTGAYDMSNWTISTGGGSVNTSGAPNSIYLVEPNNAVGGATVSVTTTAASTGIFAFDWKVGGSDCGWATSYAIVGGASRGLASNCASGSYNAAVSAGDVIGFSIVTKDGIFGSNTLTISNFSAPQAPKLSAVPLPATGMMLLTGFGAMAGFRRKSKAKA